VLTRLIAMTMTLAALSAVGATTAGAAEPATPAKVAAPIKVAVGFYAMTLQGLDQQNNSFYADFYMWMRWDDPDIDPSATFEFMNNIERWGLTQTPVYEAPKKLASGQYTQQFHVQGQFFAPLDLTTYPLDHHQLPIAIEDTSADDREQIYVLDKTESGLDPGVQIPGWNITGSSLTHGSHRYNTTFGESVTHNDSRFARATFAVGIDRPTNFFMWKLLLPLAIVMLVAISVLLIHPSLVEVRLAAPVTALLALVFLQQGYSDTLPENGNLVLLDKIYVLSYALIVALIVMTILTSFWASSETERDEQRVTKIDRWAAGLMAGVFIFGTTILVATNG
jgi:hypothetical protein